MLPALEAHHDVQFLLSRADTVVGRVPLPGFAPMLDTPTLLNGAPLPECQLHVGTITLFSEMAARLEAAGYAEAPILTADLFAALWLFGDFPALPQGSPWYYGGLPGGAAARYLLIPTCPVLPRARRSVLVAAEAEGWTLTEVARDDTFVLAEIGMP